MYLHRLLTKKVFSFQNYTVEFLSHKTKSVGFIGPKYLQTFYYKNTTFLLFCFLFSVAWSCLSHIWLKNKTKNTVMPHLCYWQAGKKRKRATGQNMTPAPSLDWERTPPVPDLCCKLLYLFHAELAPLQGLTESHLPMEEPTLVSQRWRLPEALTHWSALWQVGMEADGDAVSNKRWETSANHENDKFNSLY